MLVGVISDTHGLLRPEAVSALRGVDHILHGGDIGREGLIETLEAIAPVTAIRGNVDTAAWASDWPEARELVLADNRLHMRHDLKTLDFDPVARGFDVVISGHSHKPRIMTERGVLFLNPGAAGPRRFKLPVTLSLLTLGDAAPSARIIDLPV